MRSRDRKSERMREDDGRNRRIPTESLEMHEQTRSSFLIETYCFVNAFLVDNKQNKKQKKSLNALISVAHSRALLSLWRIHMCIWANASRRFLTEGRVNKPLLQVGRLTPNCNSSRWAAGDISQSRLCLVDTCLRFLLDKSKQTDCKLLREHHAGDEARNQVCQVIAHPSGILPPWDVRQPPQIDFNTHQPVFQATWVAIY